MKANTQVVPDTQREGWQFWAIFIVCFGICLVVATIARIAGWHWHPWPAGPEGYTSIVHEAKVAAETMTTHAFMA